MSRGVRDRSGRGTGAGPDDDAQGGTRRDAAGRDKIGREEAMPADPPREPPAPSRLTRVLDAVRDLPTRVDAALLAPGPAGRLVLVHALVASVIGLRLATRDWTLIAARPRVLTANLTVVSWWPGPTPAAALVTLQVVGLLGVVLVLARRRPRLGFAIAWTAYLVLTALWGSSGKVMHNDVLTVLVGAVLLPAAPPGRPLPVSRLVGIGRPERQIPTNLGHGTGWPPRAALAVVGTVYLLTGVQKIRGSGLDWVLSENMQWVLRQGTSPFGPELTALVADHLWVTQLLAGGALALELTAPIWLAIRWARIPFAVAVAFMHGSIWVCLGLDYSAWVLTVAAVVAGASYPIRFRARRRSRRAGG